MPNFTPCWKVWRWRGRWARRRTLTCSIPSSWSGGSWKGVMTGSGQRQNGKGCRARNSAYSARLAAPSSLGFFQSPRTIHPLSPSAFSLSLPLIQPLNYKHPPGPNRHHPRRNRFLLRKSLPFPPCRQREKPPFPRKRRRRGRVRPLARLGLARRPDLFPAGGAAGRRGGGWGGEGDVTGGERNGD